MTLLPSIDSQTEPKADVPTISLEAIQAATSLSKRRRFRLSAMLARAEREGARLQYWARSAALVAIALFFLAFAKWGAALAFTLSSLGLFYIIGLINYRLVKRRLSPPWLSAVIGTLDIVLLTFLIVGRNPFGTDIIPPAMHLREGTFAYLLIFVSLGALTLSPRLALWLGLSAALSWTGAIVWVISRPGTYIASKIRSDMELVDRLHFAQDPNYVDIIAQSANVVLILIVTGILAIVVSRSRRLADDYIAAERSRINLARHFSPNVVDELASADEPFGPVRRQEVAVVFADIVGFTNYSEDHPAEEVFELLRQFHRRMEQVVFDHGGTVDNYIGDCIMATFGVPRPTETDATRAMRCAWAMMNSMNEWNARRIAAGEEPIEVGIGCQYGPVVLGAVGSERNLSIAVVGDTCNVASRLQALCRELDAGICVGASLVKAVGREDGIDALSGLVDHGLVTLRGRDEPVNVWAIPRVGKA
ncbi:adenylate/guanylate cyclase domain-containing protein [Mesorhizobium sp. CGMCC 1.15528]|uniref:Adenylate/guanylate cyclase domain-containing protein n=1 Tax=Mesorhizobium zhangyense TaxID=1776730 RepID=A0A7C9VAV3_9HYPH|nr:adenylate/guanylate cyclase domain-containing protein [Mesorhizobium zhangyense]NGN42746.1 adenylate/guanylate cyclase domain-containing protein [Mesorhizobium zhangyense]